METKKMTFDDFEQNELESFVVNAVLDSVEHHKETLKGEVERAVSGFNLVYYNPLKIQTTDHGEIVVGISDFGTGEDDAVVVEFEGEKYNDYHPDYKFN